LGVDQKRSGSRVGAGRVNEKMVEEDVQIAPFALRSLVLPKKSVQQERQTAAGERIGDVSCADETERGLAGDHRLRSASAYNKHWIYLETVLSEKSLSFGDPARRGANIHRTMHHKQFYCCFAPVAIPWQS
ncbi:MAG: hypothetical protein ACREOR_00345, partial [Candidatus Binatia bacterium]